LRFGLALPFGGVFYFALKGVKMKKIKFFIFVICLSVMFTFSACGSKSGDSQSGNTDNDTPTYTEVNLTLENYTMYLLTNVTYENRNSALISVLYTLHISPGYYATFENVVITYQYVNVLETRTETFTLTLGGYGDTGACASRPQIINISGKVRY
jgi:hypothetical protein